MSSTQSESSGAAGDVGAASAPGARLRQARERRGDSIAEVAQALKLAPRQVDALERGDYEALPGPAFVRGFMRNYARYLNLDPEPLIADTSAALERLRVDLSPVTNAEGDLPTAAGRRRARKSTGAAALLAGALVAVLLLGWYFDWFETTPALPVAAEPQALQVQPQVLDAPPAQPVLPPAAAVAPAPLPPAPVSPTSDAAIPAPVVDESPAQEAPAAAAAAAPAPADPAAPSEAPAAAVAASGSLVFGFDTQSWIEVRDASGRVIYAGTNPPGTTRTVQGQPPFALVIGNARAVRLEHGGSVVDLAPHIRGTVARLTVN